MKPPRSVARTWVDQIEHKEGATKGIPVEARQALRALYLGDPAQHKRGHNVLAQQPGRN